MLNEQILEPTSLICLFLALPKQSRSTSVCSHTINQNNVKQHTKDRKCFLETVVKLAIWYHIPTFPERKKISFSYQCIYSEIIANFFRFCFFSLYKTKGNVWSQSSDIPLTQGTIFMVQWVTYQHCFVNLIQRVNANIETIMQNTSGY